MSANQSRQTKEKISIFYTTYFKFQTDKIFKLSVLLKCHVCFNDLRTHETINRSIKNTKITQAYNKINLESSLQQKLREKAVFSTRKI